ncbi:unnamed protein product [Dicrocoelium dendriticum]|nr:unnamed protein product [Dicrocoelium dendriticum]
MSSGILRGGDSQSSELRSEDKLIDGSSIEGTIYRGTITFRASQQVNVAWKSLQFSCTSTKNGGFLRICVDFRHVNNWYNTAKGYIHAKSMPKAQLSSERNDKAMQPHRGGFQLWKCHCHGTTRKRIRLGGTAATYGTNE